MATPVFCCGFECGLANASLHIGSVTAGSFSATTVRTGIRSLRINPTATTGFASTTAFAVVGNTAVIRFYIRLASLPTGNQMLGSVSTGSTHVGLAFKSSDSKLYAGESVAGVVGFGATGVTVTTGVWYRVDMKINAVANPVLTDIQIDGVALGQKSTAVAAFSPTFVSLGSGVVSGTYDAYYDDLLVSGTSADYPLGDGEVRAYTATSDGTHSAVSGEFTKGTAGTAIITGTTDAYTMVDDVPIKSAIVTTDLIAAIAPASAAKVVNVKLGPASGLSAITSPPRFVSFLIAHHQAATQTGAMSLRFMDNGTGGQILNTGVVAGVVTLRYAKADFALAPSGVAWNLNASGNGSLTNGYVEFASADAAPDQYFDSLMVELEFVPSGAPPAVTPSRLGLLGVG